jgi:hypothetical protein
MNVLPHRLQRPRNPDSIMMFIMGLFASATMTHDGILHTSRASAQDGFRARLAPSGLEVALCREK